MSCCFWEGGPWRGVVARPVTWAPTLWPHLWPHPHSLLAGHGACPWTRDSPRPHHVFPSLPCRVFVPTRRRCHPHTPGPMDALGT